MLKCVLISGKPMGLRHGENFHNHPEAELAAVCDMDANLLAQATEKFGAPGYSSIEDMLNEVQPDLALLITNETRRIPPLIQLLDAGVSVFTEKPLCGLEGQHRVQESDAAVAWPAIDKWRRSNGLAFGINFNYRFFRHFRKLHDDAAEGRLGEIEFVRARAHFNCWSHVIDQILWTMGRPEWVSVNGDPGRPGAWTRFIRMGWANGAIGELDGSNLWGYDDHPLRVMIAGDKSYAEARGLDGWYRRGKSGAWSQEVEELWEVEPGRQEYSESFARMADAVVKAMAAGEDLPATGEDAWNELVFEAAAHRSARQDGARVRLDEVERDAAQAALS